MAGAATDIDRALTSIRSRADHLRHTIAKLEYNLAWNVAITWPELLGQYTVIAKQIDNIYEEIPEMIQHFVCIPRISTPNPADIPLLLRTREYPEMEEMDTKLLETDSNVHIPWETLKKKIDRFNEFCVSLEEKYKELSDAQLKELKLDRYVAPEKPPFLSTKQYKFMESGNSE